MQHTANSMSVSSQAQSSGAHDRRSFNIIALILGIAMLAGFTLLPRLATSPNAMVGKPAPNFVLPVIHNGGKGDRVELSNLQGQAVVLSFWASWCGPCRAEAPSVDRLARRLKDKGVTVLGVNTNDDPNAAVAFAQRAGLSFPIVSDEEGTVGASFGVSSLPTLVVVDKTGKVVAVRAGLTDESSLESLALSAR
ncbi:MAG: TlpA family protein disulfide reductase [Myxococcota bacterium]